MYIVEETRNAHVNPREVDYIVLSRHRTRDAALRVLERHERDMAQVCGPMGWTHNHRIVVRGRLGPGQEGSER